MALQTLATSGDSGTVSFALEILAGDPTDMDAYESSGTVSFSLDLLAVVPQELGTSGDSGSVTFSVEALSGFPYDLHAQSSNGVVTFTIEALEGGYYVYQAYAEPSTGRVSFFCFLDGGYVEPDAQTVVASGCGIKRVYERSLMGYYPLYFYDLITLAHKGWYPGWCVLWVENENNSASWDERTNNAATWSERTNHAATWKERT